MGEALVTQCSLTPNKEDKVDAILATGQNVSVIKVRMGKHVAAYLKEGYKL